MKKHESVEEFLSFYGDQLKDLPVGIQGWMYETFCQSQLGVHTPISYPEFYAQITGDLSLLLSVSEARDAEVAFPS